MASMNQVILVGNLTDNPQLRYTAAGKAVSDLRLAVSRYRPGGNGKAGGGDAEKKSSVDVDFFDVTVWEKQAESCVQHLKKGSGVLVSGRLSQDRWDDKDGKKLSRISITAKSVLFLDRKSGAAPEAAGAPAAADPDAGDGAESADGSTPH